MKASIIIPVFNKSNFTKSCLDDLSKLEDHEIIIVDNNSSDNTKEVCKNFNITYIKLESNLGFGKAVNIGLNKASSNCLIILNNDIRVQRNHNNWTDLLIEKSNAGFVGPTIGYLDSRFNFVKESSKLEDYPYSYMSGWCLASSRENWNNLREDGAYFDERFFAYYEDTDLGIRIKLKSMQFILQDIPVIHFGKQTSKQLNTHKLYLESKKKFEDKWKNYFQQKDQK